MARKILKKRMTFERFVEYLEENFPTKKPVTVSRTKTPLDKKYHPPQHDFGEASDKGTHFYIKINERDPLRIQKDTLMHEWAHCITDWGNNKDDHCDEWGKNYAKIYRKVAEID